MLGLAWVTLSSASYIGKVAAGRTHLLFFVSAAVSATVLGLLFGIQRQNTKRHASIHLETIASLDVLDTC